MGCKYTKSWSDEYKIFYFKETNEFMHISRSYCSATTLTAFNNSVNKCNKNIFEFQRSDYSIIYVNDFILINFANFSNYLQCSDISILENNKQSKYIETINGFINDSEDEEKLIENLNEFIKEGININYINENKEIIIPKDDMTISFSSTKIK